MIKLTIDGKPIEVAEGTSVMQAASELGIEIPSMCYKEGFHCHPSCMVCMVKDERYGKLQPSCALPAENGMIINTTDQEVYESRKEALELLLSDHVGDCEAPCRIACPAYMDIPQMNRFIAEGELAKAIEIVKEEIAIPLILGYICPAPCEKVCRRNTIDSPVHICQLKKFVAVEDLNGNDKFIPQKNNASGKKIAIIGSGPAGMTAAFHLLKNGHEVSLYEKEAEAGGSLRTQRMAKEIPSEAIDAEISFLVEFGLNLQTNSKIDSNKIQQVIADHDAVVLATGLKTDEVLLNDLKVNERGIEVDQDTYQTSIDKVFACGSALKVNKMAVRSVAQAKAAAFAVDQFIQGKDIQKIHRMFNSKFGKLLDEEFDAYLQEAPNRSDAASDFTQVNPYDFESMKFEAERCMHCDCRKLDNCLLRIHADTYQVDRRKYLLSNRCKVTKLVKEDVVVYEPEKCIKCGLCIETASKYQEDIGLTYIGRGFDVRIKVPYDKDLNEALTKAANECAEICPTGSISKV